MCFGMLESIARQIKCLATVRVRADVPPKHDSVDEEVFDDLLLELWVDNMVTLLLFHLGLICPQLY